MSFDGVYDALWRTDASNPLSGATAYTLAMVVDVQGPCHEYGAGLCLVDSTDATQSNRQHIGLYTVGDSAGNGHFVANGVQGGGSATSQSLPTGLTVVIFTMNVSTGAWALYVNGTTATSGTGSTTPVAWDTVALGCRPQHAVQTPYTITRGSTTMTGTGGEDITIGALAADAARALAPDTVITNYDLSTTYTLNQAAADNASSDSVTFGPPLTKLANFQMGAGVLWNRVLSSGEIASFSSDPLGAFIMPNAQGDPIELGSEAARDAAAPAEWLSTGMSVGTDRSVPIEALADQVLDAATTSVWSAGLLRSAIEPIESTSGMVFTGDQFFPFEDISQRVRDARLLAEHQRMLAADGIATREALTPQHSDITTRTEVLAKALSDPNLPSESQGRLMIIADALLRLEMAALLQTDAKLLLESIAVAATLVVNDGNTLLEIIGQAISDPRIAAEMLRSSLSNSRIFVELLQSARIEADCASENIARALAPFDLPSESIGQANTVLDALLALETSGRRHAETAVPTEALLFARKKDTTAIELWITPLLQLAAGRLLKSRGRRRFLTGWKR
jgi:hypothetical protein